MMLSSGPNPFGLREQRARKKAAPELDREYRDVLIGRPYGQRLLDYLRQQGISGLVKEESFADIIILGSDADLNQVQRLINDWMEGADFRQP